MIGWENFFIAEVGASAALVSSRNCDHIYQSHPGRMGFAGRDQPLGVISFILPFSTQFESGTEVINGWAYKYRVK
ncbi:MAG TPA: hypothetical protein VIX20_00970 [Ktedonobacteraceae bacterium]|jgi:hypothetical protein